MKRLYRTLHFMEKNYINIQHFMEKLHKNGSLPSVYCLITIYAPVNFTAPCVMFFMRASALRGGLGPGIETFLGTLKSHEPSGECDLGPKKVEIPGPNPPSVGLASMNNITHRAVKFIGA